MNYLSVCSGIEAATQAWAPLGWKPVAFSEIEKFPSAVLAHHYPDIPNLGDITDYDTWKFDRPIDLLCGGTPCQSFSIAGLRKGLEDPRGNLSLIFVEMAAKFRPPWLVWENVPGVLSSAGGTDFGTFLGALTGREVPVPQDGWRNSGVIQSIEGAYSVAWRVYDAQYFGVAQRRRRVFVVGHLGDWRAAAAVLFEPQSLCGHPPPSREAREGAAGTATGGAGSKGELLGGIDYENNSHNKDEPTGPLLKGSPTGGGQPLPAVVIDRAAFNQGENAQYDPRIKESETMDTIVARGPHAVGYRMRAFGEYQDDDLASAMKARDHKAATDLVAIHGTQDPCVQEQCAHTLGRNSGQENAVASNMQVRRLTPVECERLQGFPDNFTRIPWRGKPAEECPDAPRYKAIGNSWAVPCARAIGEAIQAWEDMQK